MRIMKNSRFLKLLAMGFLAFPLFLTSCDDDDLTKDDHYKVPSWLKGSAYEILKGEGNYTTFLEGVDLAGYTPIVNGKSILTVMAPDDDDFKIYLDKKGYTSISDMYAVEPSEVTKLIGFHLMYYAFDWSKLVNFRPLEGDDATEQESNANAGAYFKHRTKSSDPISIEHDPAQDIDINVYHFERFLPVFSNRLFETKELNAQYNYEYFYSNTKVSAGRICNATFNVVNAT